MVENTQLVEPEELTPRQEHILGTVVGLHIQTALPVGSATVVDAANLQVSSATVRNELARLEEMGYLYQPHTSAGRVPTEKGYRYFVARLMSESELGLAERRTIRHQFYQVRMALDQWMRLAAAVLARTTHATSLVTAPRMPGARFKMVKLISVSDALALLVLVLHGNTVRQEMIPLDEPLSQDTMERVSNRFNDLFQNLTVEEIEAKEVPLDTEAALHAFEEQVLGNVLVMMYARDRDRGIAVYRDGLTQMLQEPEFSEPSRVRHLVSVLEEGGLAEPMLLSTGQRPGVQVIIGGEGHWEEMDGYGLVLSRYGVNGGVSGALGVLGPLRMPYHRAISSVRYVSQLLTELVLDAYRG